MDMVSAFFVEIGLDRTKFEEGRAKAESAMSRLQDSAAAGAAAIEESMRKSVSESFRTLERHFLQFFAALAGTQSVRTFVQDVTRAETQLSILSAVLGTSVPNLSAFEMAVERVGGTIDDANGSLQALNQIVMQSNLEGVPAKGEFYRLGGGAVDPRADRVTQILQLSEAMARTSYTDAQKISMLGQIGVSAAVARLMLDPGALRGLIGATAGDAVTEAQARSGMGLTGAWAGAGQAVQSFARQVLLSVQGPMTELINKLAAWVEENKSWAAGWLGDRAREFKAWVDGIDWSQVKAAAREVAETVGMVVKAIGGWRHAAEGLVGAWLLLKTAPILNLGGALAVMASPLKDVLTGLTGVLAAFAAYQRIAAPQSSGSAPAPSAGPPAGSAQGSPPRYAPQWLDPGSPGQAIGGGEEPIATSEGAVSEGHPLPVKVTNPQEQTDTFWGYIGKAFGVLGDWFTSHAPTWLGGAGAVNNAGVSGRTMLGSGRSIGKWWTPERIGYAVDRLQKEAGLSHWGAVALVSTWAGIEAPGGPTSSNSIGGGHWGIGQWDRARGGPWIGAASYEDQVTHSIKELNTTEKAAGDLLRRAQTPEEGGVGVNRYERGGYSVNPALPIGVDRLLQSRQPPVKPAADGAASDAKTSMLYHEHVYNVARVDVHTSGITGARVARDVRDHLERELGNLAVA